MYVAIAVNLAYFPIFNFRLSDFFGVFSVAKLVSKGALILANPGHNNIWGHDLSTDNYVTVLPTHPDYAHLRYSGHRPPILDAWRRIPREDPENQEGRGGGHWWIYNNNIRAAQSASLTISLSDTSQNSLTF